MLRSYPGSPDRPLPPAPRGADFVSPRDRHARARAASLLGSLPPYHFVDELGPAGVYRFFAYESPLGVHVSALVHPATGTLGEPPSMLGQTNPNFQAPSAAQVAATPPGDTLSSAAVDLAKEIQTNGVPDEHTSNQAVLTFQTAWNNDPLSQVNGANSQLSEDGDYGPNTAAAYASIAGSAPPVNPSPAPTPTPTPSGGGQTTNEPTPAATSACPGWTVDTTNAQATAIAQNIGFHDSPVTWSDQGQYSTTIGGVPYTFVMWWENGLKAVASYKCSTTPSSSQASTTSSSAVPAILGGTLVVGALVVAGLAAKHPGMFARH